MVKTFTVNVPDNLCVDAWTENKTTTYTYNGPETLNVLVSLKGDFDIISWAEGDFDRDIDEEIEQVIALDANTDTSFAYALYHANDEWEYTFTTITNHDDSTHEEISNPKLLDMYDLNYYTDGGFRLDPIYKNSETMNEKKAKERLAYVTQYDDAYDFDTDTQAVIDTFKTNIATYLDSMSTVYPWRYIEIDPNEIPKVPASLVITFNDLPNID